MVRYAKLFQNNKLPISLELFCWFLACIYTSREATVWSCCFSLVCSSMLKVLWNNKSPISQYTVDWFCWFFASSHLHHVGYRLKLPKVDMALSGIGSQPIRFSCFKLKRIQNCMRYQVDCLFPWKLQKICYFELCCQILLVNQLYDFLLLTCLTC